MEHSINFKRMVLRLPYSATDYVSVAFAAELADLLGLDIVGMFIEDEDLRHLAALPCVRELRPLGGGWHPIDAVQLAKGSNQAAADARRLFQAAAGKDRTRASFSLARGSAADVIGPQSSADDIVVVIEPKNPVERVSHQFRQAMDAAFNVASAMLIVPSRLARRSGPVVAVAASEEDPSILTALAVAAIAKERLVVVAPPLLDLPHLGRAGSVPFHRLALDAPIDVAELARVLSHAKERVLVLSRETSGQELPSQLASQQGVPVLITGPADRSRIS